MRWLGLQEPVCDENVKPVNAAFRGSAVMPREMRTTMSSSARREGVLRVLKAARAPGVRRVVLTSALGAVAYGHPPRERPFTEEDWTNIEGGVAPYQKSKTLSERAAWDFIEREARELELSVFVHFIRPLARRTHMKA